MSQNPAIFRAFVVEQFGQHIHGKLLTRRFDQLPAGDVLIRVSHSSLNYKDAMAATGHKGIVKAFPHVPGIDAAGVVIESSDAAFNPGDEVIATGREIGVERWGGWSEYLRVPAAWVQKVPQGLSATEAMVLGTAGFTAAQCVAALIDHGVKPDGGEIVVTGATGGVGILAVKILAKLGYRVAAVSGKESQTEWLTKQGATRVVPRSQFVDTGTRPLLPAAWAGGVDTVGGQTLATMIRSTQHRGCVAACGVVGGAEVPMTVYPFILRGVRLIGIDSAWCPDEERAEIWRRLGQEWKPDNLQSLATIVPLDKLSDEVQTILAGQHVGRTVVSI